MEFYSLLVIISYTIQHNNYAYSIYTIDIAKNQDGIYMCICIYTHIWGYMEAIRKHNIIFCETWASADLGVCGVLGVTLNGDWNDEYVLCFLGFLASRFVTPSPHRLCPLPSACCQLHPSPFSTGGYISLCSFRYHFPLMSGLPYNNKDTPSHPARPS